MSEGAAIATNLWFWRFLFLHLYFLHCLLPERPVAGYRVSAKMGFRLMNKTQRRARAIAIAQTRDNAKLVAVRLLMLATGATAACMAYLAVRGF